MRLSGTGQPHDRGKLGEAGLEGQKATQAMLSGLGLDQTPLKRGCMKWDDLFRWIEADMMGDRMFVSGRMGCRREI